MYKSAEELGIQQWEYHGLIRVREMLLDGSIPPERFNMSLTCERTSCGSVACIGGWLAIFSVEVSNDSTLIHEYVSVSSGRSDALHDLFFPPGELDWDAITVENAVEAIGNFLTTGVPAWEDICDLPEDDDETL